MGDIGPGTRNDMQVGACCRTTLEEGLALARLGEKTWMKRKTLEERRMIRW